LVERLSDDAGLFKDFVNTTLVPQRTDVKYEPKSQSVKERLYKEQNSLCNGCGNEYLLKDLEIDHIIPVIKGGGSYYENYQLLCGNCNKIKNDRPMEYLRMKLKAREELLKSEIEFGEEFSQMRCICN
jgi:site-specific DNA-methyltransferase (adenine-specific)